MSNHRPIPAGDSATNLSAVDVLPEVCRQNGLGLPDERVVAEKRKRALNPMWRNSVPKLDFCGGRQPIPLFAISYCEAE